MRLEFCCRLVRLVVRLEAVNVTVVMWWTMGQRARQALWEGVQPVKRRGGGGPGEDGCMAFRLPRCYVTCDAGNAVDDIPSTSKVLLR